MKKHALILASLLMLTSKSFCQTATESDSLIILPTHVVLSMITDIKTGDDAREENEMLEEQLVLQAQYVDQADSAVAFYKKNLAIMAKISEEREQYIDTYKLQLDKVSYKSEKQRKWINYLLIGLGTSLIINFSH